MNFHTIQLGWPLETETMELPIRFHTFTVAYILCTYLSPVSKIYDRVGTRKTVAFVFSFITHKTSLST